MASQQRSVVAALCSCTTAALITTLPNNIKQKLTYSFISLSCNLFAWFYSLAFLFAHTGAPGIGCHDSKSSQSVTISLFSVY